MDSGAPAQLYAVCDGTGPHEAAAGAAMRTVAALFALQGAHPAGIPDAALLHAMQTLTDAVARVPVDELYRRRVRVPDARKAAIVARALARTWREAA